MLLTLFALKTIHSELLRCEHSGLFVRYYDFCFKAGNEVAQVYGEVHHIIKELNNKIWDTKDTGLRPKFNMDMDVVNVDD